MVYEQESSCWLEWGADFVLDDIQGEYRFRVAETCRVAEGGQVDRRRA